MQWFRAWFIFFVLLGISVQSVFSDDRYIDPDLLNVEKIREEDSLSENTHITQLYVFVAIKKGAEYEAYVTKNDRDLDGDSKSVLDEPNDLSEFEMLTTFSNDLSITEDQHICYITALPNFDVLFPNLPDPFATDGIVEISTKAKDDDEKRLEGSKTLPLIDAVTGNTVGVERYVAFYNKEVKTVEITKKVKGQDGKETVEKTGETKETIGPGIGSYGFIFMHMEESDN